MNVVELKKKMEKKVVENNQKSHSGRLLKRKNVDLARNKEKKV